MLRCPSRAVDLRPFEIPFDGVTLEHDSIRSQLSVDSVEVIGHGVIWLDHGRVCASSVARGVMLVIAREQVICISCELEDSNRIRSRLGDEFFYVQDRRPHVGRISSPAG